MNSQIPRVSETISQGKVRGNEDQAGMNPVTWEIQPNLHLQCALPIRDIYISRKSMFKLENIGGAFMAPGPPAPGLLLAGPPEWK